ncbi:MAG: AraC family transcriptional regulator [Spirochaetota bacterium]
MDTVHTFLAGLPIECRRVLFTVSGASIRTISAGVFRAPRGLRTVDRFGEYRFLYVLSGSGTYRDIRGVRRELVPGSIVHRKPGLKHSISRRTSEPWIDFYFTLPSAIYQFLAANGFLPDTDVSVPVKSAALAAVGTFLRRMRGAAIPIRHLGELCHMLASLNECTADVPRTRIERIVDDACDELTGAPKGVPNIPAIAARLGIGYETFRKEFKRITGHSPYAYHVRSTIERAQRLFAEERMNASEAARALGYPDLYSFVKQFKRYTGVTPTQFRRSVQ